MSQNVQPERCVADAAILLDLSELSLLPALLNSDVQLVTTPYVLDDLDNRVRGELTNHGAKQRVVVEGADEAEMKTLLAEVGSPSQMTCSDKLICRVAKRMKLPLLTGCNWLHRDAERQGIRARTLLWVLDRLVTTRMVAPATAANRLHELQRLHPWLNKKLCQDRFIYWQKMIRPNIVMVN